MLGSTVQNYEVRAQIGRGGMGVVYLGVHPILGRKVAIKVLHAPFASDERMVGRLVNEARAANAIRHPNVVDILDVGLLPDQRPYLVMELLEGEPLSARLASQGAFELDPALDIVRQVGAALEAGHALGIVHRDIKPENIFLARPQGGGDQEAPPSAERAAGRQAAPQNGDAHAGRGQGGKLGPAAIAGEPSGVVTAGGRAGPGGEARLQERVKVLDFGIAKVRDELSSVVETGKAILGSPLYMSPEQCRGLAEAVDARTDVYALGAVAYHLLGGVPPFTSEAWGDLLMMHIAHRPRPLRELRPSLPEAVEAVILRALAKRPDDRPSGAAELIRLLDEARAAAPAAMVADATSAPAADTRARSGRSRPGPRRPWPALGLGTVLVLLPFPLAPTANPHAPALLGSAATATSTATTAPSALAPAPAPPSPVGPAESEGPMPSLPDYAIRRRTPAVSPTSRPDRTPRRGARVRAAPATTAPREATPASTDPDPAPTPAPATNERRYRMPLW